MVRKMFIALSAGVLATSWSGLAVPAMAESAWLQHEMSRPRPPVVAPAAQDLPTPAPADAIVLFSGGGDLGAWESVKGGPAPWTVTKDDFAVMPKSGAIQTREKFGDVQLHVEWSAPTEIVGTSQGRGNSGVFLMGRYEVQVLDSYQNQTYADGQAAAIYGQYPPLANSIKAPGQWNAYDIVFRRPRFGPSGQLLEPARLTVTVNGIVAQNNEELWGGTNWLQASPYAAHADALPIMLQDHGNPVRFRNIWLRPLPERPAAPPRAAMAVMEMTPEALDRYVGSYEREPGQYTILTRDGDQLYAQVLGDKLLLRPMSPTEFDFVHTDARLRFELGEDGKPTGLVMNLGGVDYPAARKEETSAEN